MTNTYRKLLNHNMHLARKLKKEEEAIKLLVLELSNLSGAEFLSEIDKVQSKEHIEFLQSKIDEYLYKNHPVQHIVGYSYFYGYKMKVNKDVLIPRFETEELVGYILSYYDEIFKTKKIKVVDIGTGSGNIAIALAKEEPNMEVSASDISPEAMEVAKENAKNNDAKVNFVVGDMLEPFIKSGEKFDILVSNPPYIPDTEFVEDIVKDNEPHLALFGGSDGMKFYDMILKDADKILNYPALIAFEHSYNKKEQMINLAKKYFSDSQVEVIKDMQGKDRMTFIKIYK